MSTYFLSQEIERVISSMNLENREKIILLPSMHSTDCKNAESILSNGEMITRPCSVFNGRPSLYFFYGKPAYRVSAKVNCYRTDDVYSPCCFIVDTKKIDIKYMYPFDTGAENKGMYEKIQYNGLHVNDFELKPNVDSIQNYIQCFWGDNNNYLRGLGISLSEVNSSIILACLNTLLSSSGALDFDDRARTLEIITNVNVCIADTVKAIIVPSGFLGNYGLKSFIRDHPEVEVISFYSYYPANPSSYYGAVYQKAMEYISRKGENI